MKNGLLRIYLIFIFMALALSSCENHGLTQNSSRTDPGTFQRKPDERHPVEPNGIESEGESNGQSNGQKNKKIPRRMSSRSANLC